MKQFYIANKNGFFNLYGLWLLSFLLFCVAVFSEKVITLHLYQETMDNELIHLFIVQHVNHTLQTFDLKHKEDDDQLPNEEFEDKSKIVYPLEETIYYKGVQILLSYDYELVDVEFRDINRRCQFQIHYEMEQYFIMKIEYQTNACSM